MGTHGFHYFIHPNENYLFRGEIARISRCNAGLHDTGRDARTKSHVYSSNSAEQDLKKRHINFCQGFTCRYMYLTAKCFFSMETLRVLILVSHYITFLYALEEDPLLCLLYANEQGIEAYM